MFDKINGSGWKTGACWLFLCLFVCAVHRSNADERISSQRATASSTIRKAVTYFDTKLALRGGYVYYYSEDLNVRWGEGLATSSQIWVQPPATPTVGMACLKVYSATGEAYYLEVAKRTADALVYGQLRSGGWRNSIDFDSRSPQAAAYRNGKGNGSNASSLDDGQSQSAVRFLIQIDAALQLKDATIHEATEFALAAILEAQFENGGFPQTWTGPVSRQPPKIANYPPYDWRTEGRIKNYWDMYTLNDNTCGYLAETLIEAYHVYQKPEYMNALKKLGDFLILAQMPEPQPGWAQQYSYEMRPIWARKFEPPGVSGDESQEVIETLMLIARATKDTKYLAPIPAALQWLERSKLSDNRLARYYELKTNRPIYMKRVGEKYELTYDDHDLPDHYGWKTDSRIALLRDLHRLAQSKTSTNLPITLEALQNQVDQVVKAMDNQGRWLSTFRGERLTGQPKFADGDKYVASEVFCQNLSILADFLERTKTQ